MDRQHGALFGYRIYRRKFWGTVAVLLVMSTAVFLGMTAFFVNTWMAAMGNEAQSRFLEREQELANIQEWATEYVNNLYGNERLMEDLAVLFQARSEAEYISLRRENSLGTASQIRYIPADIKNILFNNRNRIRSVTLRSDSGAKTIWLQNMDVCLSFDADAEADSGDIPVAVCSIRDPRGMGRIMGTMTQTAPSCGTMAWRAIRRPGWSRRFRGRKGAGGSGMKGAAWYIMRRWSPARAATATSWRRTSFPPCGTTAMRWRCCWRPCC